MNRRLYEELAKNVDQFTQGSSVGLVSSRDRHQLVVGSEREGLRAWERSHPFSVLNPWRSAGFSAHRSPKPPGKLEET